MYIYNGHRDKTAPPTDRTVAVISAGMISGTRDSMTVRQHGRGDISLFYCEKGCMYFGDTVLNSGEIWIYPKDRPQTYTVYKKDNTVYRYLHFTGSSVSALLKSLGIPLMVPFAVQNVSALMCEIEKVLSDDPLSQLCAEYSTLRLLSVIAMTVSNPISLNIMKRVTDDMEHSFAEQYDAKRYADIAGLSVSRFNHLFSELVGVPPYTYILRLRIDNATSMLERTDLKIGDIAYRCGFNDALYFTQAFKRVKNMTPSQYRKGNVEIIRTANGK